MSGNQALQADTAHANNDMDGDGEFDFDIAISDADLENMQSAEPVSVDVDSLQVAAPSPNKDDVSAGIPMFDEAEEAPKKKSFTAIIVAGVILGVIVIGVFGYFAVNVLGGSNSQTAIPAQASSQFGSPDSISLDSDFENGNGTQSPSPEEAAQALDASLSGATLTPKEVADPVPAVSNSKGDRAIVITYGADSLSADVGVVDSGPAQQVSAPKSLTNEERLYDNLLTSVEGMDIPPEAIKIDQEVINRRLESQRFISLESDLKGARESMAAINGSVESIRTQVATFAQVIDKSSADQAAMSDSISKLTAEVKQAAAAQEKELKALKAAVASVQKRADQAVERAGEAKNLAQTRPAVGPAAAEKVQPRPAAQTEQVPVVRASAPVQQQQAATVVAPSREFTEVPVPRSVQAPIAVISSTSAALPAHCDGSRVSANWRVKGVNSHSAYVVRSQDQQGIYLKVGVEVPGYGHVQSFDANSRAICTTSGLIRR